VTTDFRDRWEYQVCFFRADWLDQPFGGRPLLASRLNDVGGEGWELVNSFIRDRSGQAELVCILKRRRVE
jgi:hypothetical protein